MYTSRVFCEHSNGERASNPAGAKSCNGVLFGFFELFRKFYATRIVWSCDYMTCSMDMILSIA